MSFRAFSLVLTSIHALLSPRVFVPVTVILYVLVSVSALTHMLKDPARRANFLSGDAKAYLAIAGEFAGGNLSMDYVKDRPHRQPLYPAALASVIRLKGQNFFWLAMVNIAFATLGFLVVYGALLYLHTRHEVAAAAGILYLATPFLFAQTTGHFMTEPLHILLMCAVIFAFLAYLEEGRAWQLLVAAGAAGFDYLTRPNGLFVMLSLCGALAVAEAARCFAARKIPSAVEAGRKAGLYAAAALLFIVVTIPSWAPRLHAFGNPVYHGYLSNYLWVDSYALGHTPAKYGWRDYVETHSVGDAIQRGLHGLWNVGFSIPFRMELKFPALFLLALAGVLLAALRGPSSYRVLAIFGILQLLPLMWTNVSNPNVRVPYAAAMPFEIVFAAFCLSAFAERAGLRSSEKKIASKPAL